MHARFTSLLKYAEDKGNLIPMKTKSFTCSHLLFVDDVLLFAKASKENAVCLKIILDSFVNISGLRVNPGKSSIFFNANASPSSIVDVLGIELGSFPTRYLVVPLFTGMLTKKLCEPLVDNINAKLDSWKMKYLSMTGRTKLIISTLSAYHLYWTLIFPLPSGTIADIEKLCCNFL